MKHPYLLYLAAGLCMTAALTGCQPASDKASIPFKETISIAANDSLNLTELDLLDPVYIALKHDTLVAVDRDTEHVLKLVTLDGKQAGTWGNYGQGAREMLEASFMSLHHGQIDLYDARLGRYLSLDTCPNPQTEPHVLWKEKRNMDVAARLSNGQFIAALVFK